MKTILDQRFVHSLCRWPRNRRELDPKPKPKSFQKKTNNWARQKFVDQEHQLEERDTKKEKKKQSEKRSLHFPSVFVFLLQPNLYESMGNEKPPQKTKTTHTKAAKLRQHRQHAPASSYGSGRPAEAHSSPRWNGSEATHPSWLFKNYEQDTGISFFSFFYFQRFFLFGWGGRGILQHARRRRAPHFGFFFCLLVKCCASSQNKNVIRYLGDGFPRGFRSFVTDPVREFCVENSYISRCNFIGNGVKK